MQRQKQRNSGDGFPGAQGKPLKDLSGEVPDVQDLLGEAQRLKAAHDIARTALKQQKKQKKVVRSCGC